jgi:hypothetical protein
MAEVLKLVCSDCEELDRRGFIGALGKGMAVLGGLSPLMALAADEVAKPAAKNAKPAEAMIRELFASLSADQKKELVYPWNHGGEKDAIPTRQKMVNAPHFDKVIGESYSKPQQELVHRILRAICSGDDGYDKISRGGTFDSSGSFEGLGALIFGEPVDNKPFALVFSGHHLTIRCDGNSEPGAAFGGPMYYGHSPNGYSDKNIFNYQTKSVISVFDALNGDQRKKAVIAGKSPGEQAGSVKFRPASEAKPGIAFAELAADQKKLVEQVMRTILSPYRKEDADEVMTIVKSHGGMEKINLAFYEDDKMNDKQPWHFWRLEGPGFVWNYRVLPHVHTFVNISGKA